MLKLNHPHTSALAWTLINQAEKNTWLQVPSIDLANEIYEQVKGLNKNIKVFILHPHTSNFIYFKETPSKIKQSRINFFSNLFNINKDEKSLFIFPIINLNYKSPSKKYWINNKKTLSIGQKITKHEVLQKLNDFEYQPSDQVESPFTFCSRASILDIYSPNYSRPIRITILDEKISTIYFYSAINQRSEQKIETVEILPCLEFNLKISEEQNTNIKKKLYSLGFDSQKSKVLTNKFSQQLLFNELNIWAPMIGPDNFNSSHTELYEHLKENNFSIINCNTEKFKTELLNEKLDFKKNINRSIDEDYLLPIEEFFPEILAPENFKIPPTENQLNIKPDFNSENNFVDLSHNFLQLREVSKTNKAPLDVFVNFFQKKFLEKTKIVVFSNNSFGMDRLKYLFEHLGVKCENIENPKIAKDQTLNITKSFLKHPFFDKSTNTIFIQDEHIFGNKTKFKKSTYSKAFKEKLTKDLSDLTPNDFVVHSTHGIGTYKGTKSIKISGNITEFLQIEYQKGDKLLVPIDKLNLVSKFSDQKNSVRVDTLGSNTWKSKKAKAKKELKSIAGELLKIIAVRKNSAGPEMKIDMPAYNSFCTLFPYEETEDQQNAINETIADLEKPHPMDRLICGDVGFGKTEIALRAAFIALNNNYKVAFLCPTTILCSQHEKNIRERFSRYKNIKIVSLSRFNSKKQITENIKHLTMPGPVLVIGTHRLLSNDITFKNLGLLIVDEEQRFGVTHKEKIKKLRNNVHVLTLTATPIPRTLNMGLTGLKDISIITTPPEDRKSVKTYVSKKTSSIIEDALIKETSRGGQIFYLHNKIKNLPKIREEIISILPKINIQIAHGQMKEGELENTMLNFYNGKIQLLLCTTIIESGIDIANANTLIVDGAENFGLSQLYQIRGRVGRSSRQSFCYFLTSITKKITSDAAKRIEVLEQYQELGSGFHIASHDLDLRGTGDLLGRKQSGQLLYLGFDTYVTLLNEAIAEAQGKDLQTSIEPEIKLPLTTILNESYIQNSGMRLYFYKKLATSTEESEIDDIDMELLERFGSVPIETTNLLNLHKLRCQLLRIRAPHFSANNQGISLTLNPDTPLDLEVLIKQIKKYPHLFKLTSNNKIYMPFNKTASQESLFSEIFQKTTMLEQWCN